MPSLFTFSSIQKKPSKSLSEGEKLSIAYHNIFDYPLNFADLIKWTPQRPRFAGQEAPIVYKNGYYFVEGKEGTIYKRKLNKRISQRKLLIAKKAANILSYIPTIKMIAVTGSLAMENSNEESDIDLMIIAKKGMLWTTRLFAYFLLSSFGVQRRHPIDKEQKDRLCLNMWMDESDLIWKSKDRNLYTAHEIAQIVPLINKDNIYEKFLWKNKWILNFWPNSVRILNLVSGIRRKEESRFLLIEKMCFWIQKRYMEKKITREVVTPTRALFHPQDWGKVVLERLA